MPSDKTPQQALQRYVDRQGRLAQLGTLMGLDWIRAAQERQGRNEEAENVWYRKQMGVGEADVDVEQEDMQNVQLGDNHYPAPVVVQPPQSQLTTAILSLLMGAGLGVGGYLLGKGGEQPKAPEMEIETESVSIGLGRIQDYIKE